MNQPRRAFAPWFGVLALVLALLAGVATAEGVETLVQRQTAELRGIRPTAPVALQYLSREELRQMQLDEHARPETAEELRVSEILLEQLGLLDPDADLGALVRDLLVEQVAGFYRPRDRSMYLVGDQDLAAPEARITLAHEFTHALQDQRFDLRALLPEESDNDDRSLAIRAVVEGDATLTMSLYAFRHLTRAELDAVLQADSAAESAALEAAPLILRRELTFPYRDGLAFVLAHFQRGGWDAVNALYDRPPGSTSEVLHPELYDSAWTPTLVALGDGAAALGPDWRELRRNVLGELDLQVLLEQFVGETSARQAADGWAGDAYGVFEDGSGRAAVHLRTVWRDEAEAAEFFAAYADAVQARYGADAELLEQAEGRRLWLTPNGGLLLEQTAATVQVAIAPDPDLARALGGH
jgi:hypothetical protein